jgi:nitrite transporter NirC
MTKERILLNAVMAGLFIGLAGLIYLSVENKVIGAVLFSFGLLMVVSKGYFLYTGKVGYLIPYEKGYVWLLVKTFLGNVIGIGLVGLIYQFSGKSDVIDQAALLSLTKLESTWYQTLILAIFCGMLMYVAVQGYKVMKLDLMKVLVVIFAVTIFILSKFEHSVANLLYFFIGGTWSIKAIFYILLWVLGNGIGAVGLNIIEVKLKD